MTTRQVQTHQVSVDRVRGVVSKRFTDRSRGEPEREWRALLLLAEHAPGLAPEPLRADLAASPALIEMSLLPGAPVELGSAGQQAALVAAVLRLWASVPVRRVDPLPGEKGNEAQLVAVVSKALAVNHDLGPDPVVAAAYQDGSEWFAAARDRALAPLQPTFGQGDPNLANFLWDGERMRLVDFEDSGPSDRAFELAVLVEHLSAWHDAGLAADGLIDAVGLTLAETARLGYWRRLAAFSWLLLVAGAASGRNPPGTLRRQAERLLSLL